MMTDADGSILHLQIFDGLNNDILGSLEHLPADDDLIENAVDLMEVEDDVQFADIPEVLVKVLHKKMDELRRSWTTCVDHGLPQDGAIRCR